MIFITVVLLIIIFFSLIAFFIRIEGSEISGRSRGIVKRKSTELKPGRNREKMLFAKISKGTALRHNGNVVYEQPLDIAQNGNNNVLPPPEEIQGINNGNEII